MNDVIAARTEPLGSRGTVLWFEKRWRYGGHYIHQRSFHNNHLPTIQKVDEEEGAIVRQDCEVLWLRLAKWIFRSNVSVWFSDA